jgi:hypothetical protein
MARAIEMTHFPIPKDADHAETNSEVRAADLIGQLGDPLCPSKLNALYYEFLEIDRLKQVGYETSADMIACYPTFFWNAVEPYIGDALRYLDHTIEGKQWIAHLYVHVLLVAHHRQSMGPHL